MRRTATALGVVGAAAFAMAGWGESTPAILRLAVAGATLGATAATDAVEHRIPNRIVLPATAACAALSLAAGISSEALVGLAAVVGLLLLSLAAPSALGMGDIKLMLVIVLGVDHYALRALVASLVIAGIGAAIVLATQGKSARNRSLPLAPFLALGSLLAVL